jgi:hypothetical protein
MFVHGHSIDSPCPVGPPPLDNVVEGSWVAVEAALELSGKGSEGVRRTPGSWCRVFVGSIQISFTAVKDGKGEGLLLPEFEAGVVRT